jgi:hypothetical protein
MAKKGTRGVKSTAKKLAIPVGRALASQIPLLGGIATEALNAAVDRVTQRRIKQFESLLEDNGGFITEAMLDDDEMVHRIAVTLRAVARESQGEKIACFARLLINGGIDQPIETDQYDDLVKILESLSLQELRVLQILDKLEKAHDGVAGNSVQRTSTYWTEFHDKLIEAGIPQDEHAGLLGRLTRTGLYTELTGTYLDYAGGQGVLTGTWVRFRRFVVDRELDRRAAAQAPP